MALHIETGPSGLEIVIDHDPAADTNSMALVVNSGNVSVAPELSGIGGVYCTLIGDRLAPSRQAAGLDTIRLSPRYDHVMSHGTGSIEPLVLQLSRVALMREDFDTEQIRDALEARTVRKAEILRDPYQQHLAATDYVVFGTPYGQRPDHHARSMPFTSDELTAYRSAHYRVGNMTLFATGVASADEVLQAVRNTFSAGSPATDATPLPTPYPLKLKVDSNFRTGLVVAEAAQALPLVSITTPLTHEFRDTYLQDSTPYDVALCVINEAYLASSGAKLNGVALMDYHHPDAWKLLTYSVGHSGAEQIADAFFGTDYTEKMLRAAVEQHLKRSEQAGFKGVQDMQRRYVAAKISGRLLTYPEIDTERAEQLTTGEIRAAMEKIVELIYVSPRVEHVTGSKEQVMSSRPNSLIDLADFF